ncbi:hypothetical protein BCR43DRAFT_486113 [Syncephalastrum racemosum]|uniref:Uncharacterized protein n=1 Tax=Syncephalastrum racemosum TaxID=13706 RepID=A0A1X2HNN3_SYNRA|nr:hypothetical protein BCR43DRAFT_486113 [Syncephalastrum racemosum]
MQPPFFTCLICFPCLIYHSVQLPIIWWRIRLSAGPLLLQPNVRAVILLLRRRRRRRILPVRRWRILWTLPVTWTVSRVAEPSTIRIVLRPLFTHDGWIWTTTLPRGNQLRELSQGSLEEQ